MALSTFLAFCLASFFISLSPGPGAIAAMSAGLSEGFRRGYFLTLGLVLGIWTQVLVVVVGLGAVIQASGTAFTVLKFLGAGYLVYLGISQWRAGVRPLVAAGAAPARSRQELVLRGWGVNATNPKGTLFLLAAVPQFLDLAQALPRQYLEITMVMSISDLVVMGAYTAFAARVLRTFNQPGHMRWMNRCFGGIFVGLGALLASVRRIA